MQKSIYLFTFLFLAVSPFAVWAQANASASEPAQAASPEPKADTNFHDLEAPPSPESETRPRTEFRSRQFINLTMGLEHDVKLPMLPKDYVIKGDYKRIVRAQYSKEINTIRFTPVAEGFATLTIHNKKNNKIVVEFRIDVKKSELDKVVREVRGLLGDIEGIQIKVVNNKVIVDGQILLPRDLLRITNVLTQFGDKAASLVTISPLAQKKIAEFISRDINNPEIEVRAVNDKIILSGYAASPTEKENAELIARTYLSETVIDPGEEKAGVKKKRLANDGIVNLIQIKEQAAPPPKKMVQIVVHFVEINKDYMKKFGFDFSPRLGADNTGIGFQVGGEEAGITSQIAGTITSLIPKLHSAKEHGQARVLDSTSVIIEDGKAGTVTKMESVNCFIPGGEKSAATVTSTEAGLMTSIKPAISGDKSGNVSLELMFEMSVPKSGCGKTTNKVNTFVSVRDRQSAAIGGLIRSGESSGFNPDAIKKAEGSIMSLYSSKAFSKNQSQFVVFVTPVIKTSASSGSEQIKKKFRLSE